MVSVSFDGSVRLWDLHTMQCKSIWDEQQNKKLTETEGILMSVAWIPTKEPEKNLIAIGTAAGIIKLVDLDRNRVTWKDELSKDQSAFDIDCNSSGLIAISIHKTV